MTIEQKDSESLLATKVITFANGWTRAVCPAFNTAGMGRNLEEAQQYLHEATEAAAYYIVAHTGSNGFPRDEERVPLAQKVMDTVNAGGKIAALFGE